LPPCTKGASIALSLIWTDVTFYLASGLVQPTTRLWPLRLLFERDTSRCPYGQLGVAWSDASHRLACALLDALVRYSARSWAIS